MISSYGVGVRLEQKLIGMVLLVVVACAILPSAKASVPITVNINPPHPSPNAGFTISGQFVGYGNGVNWVMYFDPSGSGCYPLHEDPAFSGTTGNGGTYSVGISGRPAGYYVVTVRDDFGDNSGRVCFTIG